MNFRRVERISLYPVAGRKAGKAFVIVRISDVTEEKWIQKQAIQNEKLLSTGFLISGIAHEMNNPNSFITMNTPILKEYIEAIIPIVDDHAATRVDFEPCHMPYGEFREDLHKLICNIEHGSLRINQTISRLRGLVTRHEEMEIETVSLKSVVEHAIEVCRSRTSVSSKNIEIDLPDEFPVIRTDPVALEQVLTNVVMNAIQATETEPVRIQIRVAKPEEKDAGTVIEIRDYGCGMGEAVKKHLFDPFFSTKPKGRGSGLGLYVCQSLLGALGGHMEAESEPGKGSLFRIILYESPLGETKHE